MYSAPAADFVVTNNNDLTNGPADGMSLREAVQKAEQSAGPHRITFDASVAGTTIVLTKTLFIKAAGVTIEGPVTLDVHGLPVAITVRGSGTTLRRLRMIGIESGGGGISLVADANAPVIENIVIEECDLSSDKVGGNPVAIPIGTPPQGIADVRISNVRIAGNTFEGFQGDGDGVLMGGRTPRYVLEDITIERNAFRRCTYPVEMTATAGAIDTLQRRTTIRDNLFIGNRQTISIGQLGTGGVGALHSVIEQTLVEGNTFIGNQTGIMMLPTFGATECRIEETTIRRNRFSGPQQSPIHVGINGVPDVATRGNVIDGTIIEANRILDSNSNGVFISPGDSGAEGNVVSNLRLVNNVITGCANGVAFAKVTANNTLAGVHLVNNTMAFNWVSGVVFTTVRQPGVEAVNNVVWGNRSGFIGSPERAVSNLFSDPLFVDDSFTPGVGSPAIDAGTSEGAPATDYFGRPRCGAPDIGAVERCAAPRHRAAPK